MNRAALALTFLLVVAGLLALVAVPTASATATNTHYLVTDRAACTPSAIDTDGDCWAHSSGDLVGTAAGVPGPGNPVVVDAGSGASASAVGAMSIYSYTSPSGTTGVTFNGDLTVAHNIELDYPTSNSGMTFIANLFVGGDVTVPCSNFGFGGPITQQTTFTGPGTQTVSIATAACAPTDTLCFRSIHIEAGANVILPSSNDVAFASCSSNIGFILDGTLTGPGLMAYFTNNLDCTFPASGGGNTGTPRPSLYLVDFNCNSYTINPPSNGFATVAIVGCDSLCDGTGASNIAITLGGPLFTASDFNVASNDVGAHRQNDCGNITVTSSSTIQVAGHMQLGDATFSDCFGAPYQFKADVTASRICVGSFTLSAGSTATPAPESYPCPVTGGGPALAATPVPLAPLYIALASAAVLILIGLASYGIGVLLKSKLVKKIGLVFVVIGLGAILLFYAFSLI